MSALSEILAEPDAGTGSVRALRREDIPAVAALRQRLFRHSERPAESLAAYAEQILFRNPWRGEGLASLVYEGEDGQVAGFVGIIPRRMAFGRRMLRVAVGTQLMVAPGARAVASRRLVRALITGPQDLTFSDAANQAARRIWESVGGHTALAHSLFWSRPLRPTRCALARHARGGFFRAAGYAARPLCAVADTVAARLARRIPAPLPGDTVEPFDAPLQVAALEEVLERWTLRPCYERVSLDWLLGQVVVKPHLGELQQLLVRDARRRVVGWALYCLNRGGVSQVIQVAARRGALGRVLAPLFDHAGRRGAIALEGRLDPGCAQEFADAGCGFTRDGPWTLAHARDPDIMRAIERSDAFLSRLEGEWWLSF